MHALALVIVPGGRGTAYGKADRLLGRTAPGYVDYWGFGGRFRGRLRALKLVPDGHAWPEAIPVSRVPKPVPDELLPVVLVTPRGAWVWEPVVPGEAARAEWIARVNRLVTKYRGGHTAVILDVHF